MIRLLIASPVALALVLLASLYMAYGQVDPCRALAVERARRAEGALGPAAGVERWTRAETSQLSSGQCAGDLLDSWGERLSHHWKA